MTAEPHTTGGPRDELSRLLNQIDDEALRARLRRQVDLLRDQRRFGLVFDRMLPEAARLPKHPIRVGDRVVDRDDSKPGTWRVVGFTDRSRTTARLVTLEDHDGRWAETGETSEAETAGLVVVRDYGETIHPGMELVDRIDRGQPGEPAHVVIEGENLHALQVLEATHGPAMGDGRSGLVDLIYIDPPCLASC